MNALDRHVVLIGFMGAGKSTLGCDVAERLDRPFFDVDEEVERAEGPIWEIFANRGEPAFRELEARFVRDACARPRPSVIAVGGGAVETRRLLEELDVLTVHLDVDVDTAWSRVQGSRRPLAQDEQEFRTRYERRAPLYREVADVTARDTEDVVLAAAGIQVEAASYARLGERIGGPAEVVVDEHVRELHPLPIDGPIYVLPEGERAKTVAVCERLWRALQLERGGQLIGVGGGSTTDVAGFVAATYMRGVDWTAVPTTLVGQVDAAIGGKTGIDLPEGKNLVGAFHWPGRTIVDPEVLATLPERERRNGLAEVVKTGLLAGEELWALPEPELVRRCAAFKAAVCLRDPRDLGERAMLNLGHTFAHALEAASEYALPHGEAVALGLVAAARLSGLEAEATMVEQLLRPQRPRVDPERAWQALRRDKKASGGRVRLVLLERPGAPRTGVELPDAEVRAALERLIA
jgi:shikimate kinase/3-dehydroquinate synthase